MKLYYNDNGDKILLTEVITNHSMSVDDALTLAGCAVIVTSGIYAIRLERRQAASGAATR